MAFLRGLDRERELAAAAAPTAASAQGPTPQDLEARLLAAPFVPGAVPLAAPSDPPASRVVLRRAAERRRHSQARAVAPASPPTAEEAQPSPAEAPVAPALEPLATTSAAPAAVLTVDALERLLARAISPAGLTTAQLTEVLSTLVRTSQDAMQKRLQPENGPGEIPLISAFSYPEGDRAHPKPTLRRATFHCGVPLHEEMLTPLEIELCNRIDRNLEARNGQWQARIERSGTHERLFIIQQGVKDLNVRMDSGATFALVLTELLEGHEAANPNHLLEEVTRLAERVRDLERRPAKLVLGDPSPPAG